MTTRNPNVPAGRPDRAERGPHPSRPTDATGAVPAQRDRRSEANPPEHEGAAETEIGDRTGPGAGYDDEPEQEKDRGGVS